MGQSSDVDQWSFHMCLHLQESLKVEIGILEAKGETALRKLETDLQAQAEREVKCRIDVLIHCKVMYSTMKGPAHEV